MVPIPSKIAVLYWYETINVDDEGYAISSFARDNQGLPICGSGGGDSFSYDCEIMFRDINRSETAVVTVSKWRVRPHRWQWIVTPTLISWTKNQRPLLWRTITRYLTTCSGWASTARWSNVSLLLLVKSLPLRFVVLSKHRDIVVLICNCLTFY